MQRHRERMMRRIEIRSRMKAGEPVTMLIKRFPFMQPRKLILRAH